MTRVLVIEDELSLLEEVIEWLTLEGFDAYSAVNGKEGIRMALAIKPDIILCDIMMPEMNGMEVLESVRSDNELRLVPFLFTTALDTRQNQRLGMESGADDYLVKPYTRMELFDAINARLKKSEYFKNKSEDTLNELRGSIIKSLPHELRTPLNGIMGYGQLLSSMPEAFSPGELKEIGENIHASGLRLFRLIKNYLTYAEFELGRMREVRSAPLEDPVGLFIEAVERISSSYGRNEDLILKTEEITTNIPEQVFTRIIEELADNAFKFSPAGSRVIAELQKAGSGFLLTITDEGRGISAENISRMGAYMQFDREIYEQQGSGLGLILVKKFSDLYKGTMQINSPTGAGTTVTICIP